MATVITLTAAELVKLNATDATERTSSIRCKTADGHPLREVLHKAARDFTPEAFALAARDGLTRTVGSFMVDRAKLTGAAAESHVRAVLGLPSARATEPSEELPSSGSRVNGRKPAAV